MKTYSQERAWEPRKWFVKPKCLSWGISVAIGDKRRGQQGTRAPWGSGMFSLYLPSFTQCNMCQAMPQVLGRQQWTEQTQCLLSGSIYCTVGEGKDRGPEGIVTLLSAPETTVSDHCKGIHAQCWCSHLSLAVILGSLFMSTESRYILFFSFSTYLEHKLTMSDFTL